MEYFTILTLTAGGQSVTHTMTVTTPPGATRASLYEYVRQAVIDRAGPQFATATVAFFTAEPNTLA